MTIGMVPSDWHTLEDLAHDVGCSYSHAVRTHGYTWTHSDPPPRVIMPEGSGVDINYVYLSPDAYRVMWRLLRAPAMEPRYPDKDRASALAYVRLWMDTFDVVREVMRGLESPPTLAAPI